MHFDPALLQRFENFLAEGAAKYSLQVLGGLVILFAAFFISRMVAGVAGRSLEKRSIDITVIKFITQAIRMVIIALGVLMTLSSFGVQIAPLIAGLSVAGVGIGLALQGPLSNYASGVTLIFTKPFKVGDNIEVKGFQGEVRDIALPRTELLGTDGSTIVIPNKHIIGEVVKNFSKHRTMEINVRVAYDSDVKKALDIMSSIIKSDARIANRESCLMGIKEFADSAISLQAVIGVPQAKYTEIRFIINNAILEQFRRNGIVIPVPQQDVHIIQK